jgi:predicted transglutaminase-like cysteine proteinase
MRRGTRLLLGAFATAAAWCGAANAETLAMETGGRTTQPIGHYEFCRQYPTECRQRGATPAPQSATGRFWALLTRVNSSVNAQVRPRTDMEMWGKEEIWSFPTEFGDCEDYVIEKRRRLMGMGIPGGNLLITVLRQQNGEGHAVLTVRTMVGDYVLDNLDSRIRLWSSTEYTYLKRQSERDSGVWLSISDGRADAVASVR